MVSISKTLLLVAPLLAALAGCVDLAAVQSEAERGALQNARTVSPVTLQPFQQIETARFAPSVDESGVPLPAPGPAPMQRLMRPTSVALRGGEIYVVDSGLAMVLHIALGGQMMNALPSAPAQLGVRVRASGDRSAYVVDPSRRSILRFAPNGTLAQTLTAPTDILGRPSALAIDERRGVIVVVDQSFNQLVMMPLLGGSAYPFINDARYALPKLVAVAVGADGYYAVDAVCHCVTLFGTNGTPIASFGGENLIAPLAIALDREERVFVADGADNSIKVFGAGRLIGTTEGARLGVAEIVDLDVDQGVLAIADGRGGRVVLAHVVAAASEAQ